MSEKRSHTRVTVSVDAVFTTSAGAALSGQLKDASVGGALFELGEGETAPDFGTEGTLVATLPGGRSPLALPSTVRWNRGNGIGLQFGLLGAKETHALTKLGH